MKPYPSYKDSGVEWIGDIPSPWDVLPVKTFGQVTLGKMLTSEDKGGYHLRPYLRSQNIQIESVDISDVKEMWFSDNELEKLRLKKGDLLFNEGGDVGRTSIWNDELDECYIQNSVNRVRFSDDNQKYYLFLSILYHSVGHYDSIVSRVSIPHLTKEKLESVRFLRPPKSEQEQIVYLLDKQTQKIDELIEKTEQKIELLKEKRTSLINHCVTKGLNPNVEMKDSGIEWLGEIPEHWEIIRLKFLSNIKYGLGQPPRELGDGLPLIRATNIERGIIISRDLIFVDPSDIPYDRDPILKENDIIVVRSGAYTGDSAIIPKTFTGAIAGYDLVVRVHNAEPQYIAYSLLSHSVLHNQIDLCRMRAAQPHLNAEELGNMLIFLPANPEQKQIVNYLDEHTEKIDTTIEKETQRIELLKEYRQSLISEVVTGKIDVREKL